MLNYPLRKDISTFKAKVHHQVLKLTPPVDGALCVHLQYIPYGKSWRWSESNGITNYSTALFHFPAAANTNVPHYDYTMTGPPDINSPLS